MVRAGNLRQGRKVPTELAGRDFGAPAHYGHTYVAWLTTVEKFVEADQLPHLLFYGPPGTGKTSTIMALAARLYGKSYRSHVLELNASDDRGIDVVRGQIKAFASTRNMFSMHQDTFKLIILDEADAMTQAAQAALRRIMEQYTRNVRFCIICNYVNKIIPAIQSRCTRFRFAPLEAAQVERRIDGVIAAEKYVAPADPGAASSLPRSRRFSSCARATCGVRLISCRRVTPPAT